MIKSGWRIFPAMVDGNIDLGNPYNWWLKQGLPIDFYNQPSDIVGAWSSTPGWKSGFASAPGADQLRQTEFPKSGGAPHAMIVFEGS